MFGLRIYFTLGTRTEVMTWTYEVPALKSAVNTVACEFPIPTPLLATIVMGLSKPICS